MIKKIKKKVDNKTSWCYSICIVRNKEVKMSTELRKVAGVNQTRFWGGQNRGTCIQLSQRTKRTKNEVDQFFDSLQLTRKQAKELAVELLLFSQGQEIPEEFI